MASRSKRTEDVRLLPEAIAKPIAGGRGRPPLPTPVGRDVLGWPVATDRYLTISSIPPLPRETVSVPGPSAKTSVFTVPDAPPVPQ